MTYLQDGSYSTFSYSGNCTTATDPAGISRKSCADGLGRLTQAFENPTLLNYETDYTYNLLNQLTQVSQGSQTRGYTYDGMGRLTISTTPEAGTVCIGTVSSGTCNQNGYNSFNLVTSSTDARGVATNYTYDTLNRLTQASYNVGSTGVTGTPTVSYTYGTSSGSNNNGRLISLSDGFGTNSEVYTYDILGRLTQLSKVVSSTTFNIGYGYNLANEVTQITYPSGRVVQQGFDAIGRLCGVAASVNSTCSSITTPYVTIPSLTGYNSASQLLTLNYGNGVAASFGYSSGRMQLTSLGYTNGSTTLFNLSYGYGSSPSNNGQITGITDTVQNGRSATYTYDAIGRLSAANTAGSTAYPAWGLSFTYDRYGNRTAQSIISGCTGVTCPPNSVTVGATTNQITGTGYSYDASGNMTADGYNTLTYDAASNLISVSNSLSSGAYAYDGNGLRVEKCVPSCSGTGTSTVYIFSSGTPIAEYDFANGSNPSASSPTWEYLYAGAQLIAAASSSGTNYLQADLLSIRITTNSSGNNAGEQGHFPFGESWYAHNTTTKYQFTTYEHDSESGNEYAAARYYVSRLGRFSMVDPLGGGTGDPQSLNRYAYVENDPINMVDPTGLSDLINDDPCIDAPLITGQFCGSMGQFGGKGIPSFGGGDPGAFGDDIGFPQPINLNCPGMPNLMGPASCFCDYPLLMGMSILGSQCSATAVSLFLTGVLHFSVSVTATSDPLDQFFKSYYAQMAAMKAFALRQPTNQDYLGALYAAGVMASHDLGCVGVPAGIAGGSMAASAPVIPKAFSAGGTSATSVSSIVGRTITGGANLGLSVPTPVGIPGTSGFAMRASSSLGAIAGRYLPYAGTAYAVYTLNQCLNSDPE